jgi:hypothetical protein
MECPKCNQSARVANGKFVSDVGSTDVYHEMTMVCVNPECEMNERNLDNPQKVITTIRNKVN